MNSFLLPLRNRKSPPYIQDLPKYPLLWWNSRRSCRAIVRFLMCHFACRDIFQPRVSFKITSDISTQLHLYSTAKASGTPSRSMKLRIVRSPNTQGLALPRPDHPRAASRHHNRTAKSHAQKTRHLSRSSSSKKPNEGSTQSQIPNHRKSSLLR